MPKLPRVTADKIIKALKKIGSEERCLLNINYEDKISSEKISYKNNWQI